MDINYTIQSGRITHDLVLNKAKNSDTLYCRFTLAVSRRFASTQSTDFLHYTAYNKLAQNICKNLKKGSKVAVVGELHQDDYINEKNEKRTSFYVVVKEITFLDNKPKENNAENKEESQEEPPEEPPETSDEESKDSKDDDDYNEDEEFKYPPYHNHPYNDFEQMDFTPDDLPF